jgi:hypothetical protein
MGDLAGRLDEIRHPEALSFMRDRLAIVDGVEPGQNLSPAHEKYMEILEDSAKLAVGAWRIAKLSTPHPVERMEVGETNA